MKDVGLNKEEFEKIVSVFRAHPEIHKVVLFGSRAKGTARKNSDIDLAVEGINNNLQIESLAMELEDLSLPYKFDVKSIVGICNPVLMDHIVRVGIIIYEPSS